ncbi:hypothetical protein ATO8_19224 [Roseivivax marinus]|uniref:Uncharacterized protein n=2 Tax=Roseivivax marinus TaxID=1379903 RepID=W4HE50_9RHOB|nr:hypothetical protein ATO8_19224 [Roseivivax marinus]
MQNILDKHHLKNHYFPFCAAMGTDTDAGSTGAFTRILFEHEKGHGGAEPERVFRDAMHRITGVSGVSS